MLDTHCHSSVGEVETGKSLGLIGQQASTLTVDFWSPHVHMDLHTHVYINTYISAFLNFSQKNQYNSLC